MAVEAAHAALKVCAGELFVEIPLMETVDDFIDLLVVPGRDRRGVGRRGVVRRRGEWTRSGEILLHRLSC